MSSRQVRLSALNLEKLKAYAAKNRRTHTSVLDEALEEYFKARAKPRKLSHADLPDFNQEDKPQGKKTM